MTTELHRYEAQATLFAPRPARAELLDLTLPAALAPAFKVQVWRNHNFETLMPLLVPYLGYGRWNLDFNLGPYDDTLMFAPVPPADAHLVWLDRSRVSHDLGFDDWLAWVRGRLVALRGTTSAPIVLATWSDDADQASRLRALADELAAVHVADLRELCNEYAVELIDARTAKLAGTAVSKSAQVLAARELACHWLPAVLLPPIKALALDLDHTLHQGVLGEDGIAGVQLTPGHRQLQAFARSLQRQGVFLALVSRNELKDVKALFAEREDYPLRWEDFSDVEVSWGDKASALERVAANLRIAIDAVLFVDDNPGELAQVTMKWPGTPTVFAQADAHATGRAIAFYPGLWRWKVGSDDAKRVADLKANAERSSLAQEAGDPATYFRSIQATMIYRYDPLDQLDRLAELCKKTNQFNLAMRRLNAAEVADLMQRQDACVASVQLKDRLSDSGVIAVIAAERVDRQLHVSELCVSCRALGREMEDSIVLRTLRDMPIFEGCDEVVFHTELGPRNRPARDWLARLLHTDDPIPGTYTLDAHRVRAFEASEGITLIKE